MKILILGGYGTFGGRLAQLLVDEKRLTLMIAGRSAQKAQDFCADLPPGATRIALRFDRDGDVEQQIRDCRPALVVDATGPFQDYGDDPYRVVKACLATGTHYMDLADGSGFVKGIGQFDEVARARNIFILAGVSSFPVLTAAVIRHLSGGFARITKVTGGIAPSPYAGVGPNVIRAIASYAGKRVALVRNGQPAHGHALTESMRYTIAPPGRLPLGNIRFSLVDVPDLGLLPGLLPQLDAIWIGAGPAPAILHRMLNSLAWLVRLRVLPSLLPFASIFHFVTNRVRWGEHRGGMFVAIAGHDSDDKLIERSWHLLAEGADGPFIPSMAVEAIVRRCLTGLPPVPGARAAMQELELADYAALFRNKNIHTGCREPATLTSPLPLYQRLLGDAWSALPAPLQLMHDSTQALKAAGVAVVERGSSVLSRIVGWMFNFPAQGKDIPIQVLFQAKAGSECWQRNFGGKSFSSWQSEGRGRSERLLAERFGPFTFAMALVLSDNRLSLVVRHWYFLGIPLPRSWAPGGDSYETVTDGRFCFNVEISHALTGLIVRYRGWLVPVA